MDEQNNEQPQISETKSNNSLPLITIGVVVLVAVVGFLATRGPSKPTTGDAMEPKDSTQSAIEDESTSPSAMVEESATDVITVNLESADFSYSQKEIRVKVGQKVKIFMISKDMMHDFNIDELGVRLTITKAGETNTIEFTADNAGTYEYYCSVGQHRENGQVGTL